MFWIIGARLAEREVREGALRIEGHLITGKTTSVPFGVKWHEAHGLTIVPAFIDAHVHLSVAGDVTLVSRAEVRRGVAGVLDLGEPERLLPFDPRPLRARYAGPLMTAPGGYPTQTWGKDGYGLELSSAGEARDAVARLAEKQARFVKLAFDPRFPLLRHEVAQAAADEAHKRGLIVAAHALDAESVRLALDAGADVLAHTPRDALPADLLARMKGKWVISTLWAFGVSPDRLRALKEAGARIAYGTDLGNEQTKTGIDERELALLVAAGVDPVAAATRDAADLLGFKELGRLSVGSTASLLAVRGLAPQQLADPVWVMNCGKLVV
ncbi:MAG: amidohydrolase family protein [Myxococcales bacterium]|nr:amidohydrolase family protein [Myxococcales bacterium]